MVIFLPPLPTIVSSVWDITYSALLNLSTVSFFATLEWPEGLIAIPCELEQETYDDILDPYSCTSEDEKMSMKC